jgi:putative ABC transport system permease protein
MVRQVVPQYVGLGAYMEIESLGKLLQIPGAASSILIKVDGEKAAQVSKELQGGKNVLAVQDKAKQQAQFVDVMEKSNASQYILLFFAFITGFAIVYNVNIISLSERERELATLMVLGMTEGEIKRIMLMEQAFLAVISLILGLPLSYAMLSAIINATGTDIFNMPMIFEPRSLLISLLGTGLFIGAAQLKINGRISHLAMLDVLKQQE